MSFRNFSDFFTSRRSPRRIVNVQPADPAEPPQELSWVGQTYRDESGVLPSSENFASGSARPSTPASAPIMPRQFFSHAIAQSNKFGNVMTNLVIPELNQIYKGEKQVERYKQNFLQTNFTTEDDLRRVFVVMFKEYNKNPFKHNGFDVLVPVQFLDENNPPLLEECIYVAFTIALFKGYTFEDAGTMKYIQNKLTEASFKIIDRQNKVKQRRGLPTYHK